MNADAGETRVKIERKQLSELTAAPYNPRVSLQPGMPGYERLKRSLQEFDLVQPPVWNRRTGHVVGGHQRLALLREEGVAEVDCVVVDLPEERERALNVALNNDEVGGAWDMPKLLDLLDGLQSDPAADVTLTGFTEADLTELLLRPADLGGAVPGEATGGESASGSEAGAEESPIEVAVDVPRPRWAEVRTWVDSLLAAEPTVRVHVRE